MLQHQIVQSPARLGLTNPNSPSLQNTTPPKFPSSSSSHHQQSQPNPSNTSTTATGTTATSSALQSLLPPLRRAQSLLLQMASLASKLFEVSSNRPLWLSAFRGSLPTFLSSQAQSMAPPPLESNPSSTKEILLLFTSLQTQLFEAVAELQEILDLQDAKQRLARDIKAKDSALLNFANKLKDAERVLDILVDDYSDYRRPKRVKLKPSGDVHEDNEDVDDEDDDDVSNTTVASQLNLSDILSYAHRISYTTFAPPEFGAGQAPLRGAFPPAPQDEQMRASQLYAFADLDVGLPKRDETKEKTIEPIIEPPPPPKPTETPLPVLLPSSFKIPPGWRPGMEVELPKDIPLSQLGQKLEDAFPPMASLPVPRTAEQQLQHAAPLHKPPETIQVRHVQLDIPDQDDDSSDYSTDEGSSDDED